MHSLRAFSGPLPIIALLSGLPAPAFAEPQEQPTASTGGGLNEVVVTARKRGEERLQDVPTAITAFGSDTLEKMGVTDFTDFAYQVPGLTFNNTGPGEKRYVLRGVQSAGQEQVAVYYDEVPAPGIQSSSGDSGSQTTDLELYDMERIEVLKGPQGTTFGANSQTGTVRFIANKPNLKAVAGSVKLSANTLKGGDPGQSVYGAFNLPLIEDKLAVRFMGFYDKEGGYIDNVRLGTNEINWVEARGGRAILRYQPTDKTTIDAMVWAQKRDVGGASGYNPYDTFHVSGKPDTAANDRLPAFAYFDTGDFNNGDYVQTPRPDQQTIASLTLTQDLSWSTLTVAASQYKRDFGFFRDNTWSIISLNVGPAGATCLNNQACLRPDLFPELTDQTQDITQKTGEIRLNSTGKGPLQWLGGFFYRDRDSNLRSVSPIVDPDTGLPLAATGVPTGFSTTPGAGIDGCQPCALARFNTRTIKENAVFGELSYQLFEKWEVMGGLRRFEAEQDDDGFYLFQFPLFGNTLPAPDLRHFKEDRLIKKFQISYRPMQDMTIFALASQGFRLGGTNQATVAIVPPGYDADSLWNYELGVKSTWLNRRLTVNSSIFVIDWENIQVSGRDPTGSFAFIGNAGAARIEGLEIETLAAPVDGLQLTAGLSYIPKRELTEDQVNSTVAAPGRKGDKLPRIPEWTADASATYTHGLAALPSWSAWSRVDWAYHGKSNTELRGPLVAANRVQRDYEITNLRVGATNDENGLDLALYVSNVFDVQGDVYLTSATATPTTKYTNQPRTIGVEIAKKF